MSAAILSRSFLKSRAMVFALGILLFSAPEARTEKPAEKPLPNVVFILSDTTRADHLPYHGYEKNTAPFLGTLAARGAVFERAYSVCAWTAPATSTIHTSLYPWQHGVLLGMMASKNGVKKGINPDLTINRIPEIADTMAERLGRLGYTAYAIADNINICREVGFDQGFSRIKTHQRIGADKINAVIGEWEEEIKKSAPYFLYIHYNDAHAPYEARAPWYQKGGTELADVIAMYDSSINFLDDNFRQLYARMGWGPDTLIIMAADHGEEFWDHKRAGHGFALYNEIMHVPLFFCHPAGGVKSLRIPNNVSSIDILPTLMGLLGEKPDPDFEGVDFSAALRGGALPADDRHLFAQIKREVLTHPAATRDIKAVIHKNWKWQGHHEDGEMLFDLSTDPLEKKNVIADHAGIAAQLRAEYDSAQTKLNKLPREFSPLTLDDDLNKHLKDIGYLGK